MEKVREELDHTARCISEALCEWNRLSIAELSAFLGEKKMLLARTLAWLVLRGMVAFQHERGVLYVTGAGARVRFSRP
jgi:hypothetical protein